MARHTFFSFHYNNDVLRAHVLRNAWVTQDRADAGFFDKSAFEKAKNENPDSLKRFLTSKLQGTSVTCVCVGAHTFARPWVRYEIVRSVQLGKGLLGVRLDRVRCAQDVKQGLTGYEKSGENPFDHLCLSRKDRRVYWHEWKDGKWISYNEVPPAREDELPYDFGNAASMKFSALFPDYAYDPSTDYSKIGQWIEAAARRAGR